jgi:hypothetical protein
MGGEGGGGKFTSPFQAVLTWDRNWTIGSRFRHYRDPPPVLGNSNAGFEVLTAVARRRPVFRFTTPCRNVSPPSLGSNKPSKNLARSKQQVVTWHTLLVIKNTKRRAMWQMSCSVGSCRASKLCFVVYISDQVVLFKRWNWQGKKRSRLRRQRVPIICDICRKTIYNFIILPV